MNYVRGLDRDQLNDIALYLNFDMLGSPNAGFFTYDGDQSGQPNPNIPARDVPAGSAGIERTLAGYLNLAGIRPADLPLARSTDYSAFLAAGVPFGGATTGAAQKKTEVQARLWGGRAGVAFDPNYHTPGDTIDNVDRHALSIMAAVVTVNDVLDGHVGLDVECLDRIYLNGYVPNLQVGGQVVSFDSGTCVHPHGRPASREHSGRVLHVPPDRAE